VSAKAMVLRFSSELQCESPSSSESQYELRFWSELLLRLRLQFEGASVWQCYA
jgi:hypothetical protein